MKRIEIPGQCEDPACRGPISINTLCCVRCGVSHSDRCPLCGNFGFHRADCPEMLTAPAETFITKMCMYCNLVMGKTPGEGQSGISHDICRDCWNKVCPELPYKPE